MTGLQVQALRQFAFSLVEGRPAYIAGGFATEPRLAGDVDMWILGDPTLEDTAATLRDFKVQFKETTRGEDSSVPVEDITRSIIRIDTPLIPIHVIGTKETTIQSLLDTFDISTHRWALSRAGTLIAGEGATKPWETGRVLTYRYPASTDKRVARLQTRYDIEILPYVDPKKGRAA